LMHRIIISLWALGLHNWLFGYVFPSHSSIRHTKNS
jgi:hypothetical protein